MLENKINAGFINFAARQALILYNTTLIIPSL